jgi:outer membrane protein OmpA-like peptidoglycan-associated protein
MKLLNKITFLAVGILLVSCANMHLKNGNKAFNRKEYQAAIKHYNKALEKKFVPLAKINLARTYVFVNDIGNAERHYVDAVLLEESNCGDLFNYARILMQKQDYKEAKIWFKKFLENHPEDIVAKMLYASCASVNDRFIDTSLYSLHEIKIEEFSNIYSPTPLDEGIVFAGDKKVSNNSKTNSWTGNSYLDLYFTQKNTDGKWISPDLLKGDINGKYHEGPAVFNKEGNVVYFTRNNYLGKKLHKNEHNENNLKIYRAELVNGEWKNITEMPFNSNLYSVGHPTLSEDNKELYFISDMPGGLGGTDIWVSLFDGEKWGTPTNLGKEVNTPGNEMFPYMHSDGSLYFSSDAHNSMGGLDIFITSKANNRWLTPENLNYPLNSSGDDFGFALLKGDSAGFISSSRAQGNDRIYEFVKNPPTFTLSGVVTNKKTGAKLPDALVSVLNAITGKIEQIKTDKNGQYNFKLAPETFYVLKGEKKDFFAVTDKVSTEGKKISEKMVKNLALEELVIEKPIVIENIYYDYDKWFIRDDAKPELDKLVKLLKDNPSIVVELSSHTDARASDRYNLVLSDKRAHAAVEYILTQGIAKDRIFAKGYGETKLVNHCKNNIDCSDDEHQKNRRTEFKVIKIIP